MSETARTKGFAEGLTTAPRLLLWLLLVVPGIYCGWMADGIAPDDIPDEVTLRAAVYHVKASVYLAAAVLLMAMPVAKDGAR